MHLGRSLTLGHNPKETAIGLLLGTNLFTLLFTRQPRYSVLRTMHLGRSLTLGHSPKGTAIGLLLGTNLYTVIHPSAAGTACSERCTWTAN